MTHKSVTIIGSGFSGLSLAYFLNKRGVPVQVIEAEAHCGGMLQSKKVPGFGLNESAANAFLNSVLLESLCADIGIELLRTKKASRKRYIFWNSKIRRWPLSIIETVAFIIRLVLFLVNKQKKVPRNGESVWTWSTRHLGLPFTQKLLSPALLGIYASDSVQLSSRLVLGRFFKKHRPKPSHRGSVSFREGMGSFMNQLRDHLLKRGVTFSYSHKVLPHEIAALSRESIVVIATSLHQASKLLRDSHPQMSQEMAALPLLSITKGTLFYSKKLALHGFGVLFPKEAKMKTLGVLFNHDIFEGRTENEKLSSETWILKGKFSESDFLKQVALERERIFSSSEVPLHLEISVWDPAFPCYSPELEEFLNQNNSLPKVTKSIFLSGNYLGALGLTQILEYNEALSKLLIEENKL